MNPKFFNLDEAIYVGSVLLSVAIFIGFLIPFSYGFNSILHLMNIKIDKDSFTHLFILILIGLIGLKSSLFFQKKLLIKIKREDLIQEFKLNP
jgi:hypothetical protein